MESPWNHWQSLFGSLKGIKDELEFRMMRLIKVGAEKPLKGHRAGQEGATLTPRDRLFEINGVRENFKCGYERFTLLFFVVSHIFSAKGNSALGHNDDGHYLLSWSWLFKINDIKVPGYIRNQGAGVTKSI